MAIGAEDYIDQLLVKKYAEEKVDNHDDMESLIADGQAEVCCHFCGEKYHFTKEELQHLLKLADAVK